METAARPASYKFREANTESDLWIKSLEKHMKYPEMQRGGPLIASLLTSKIQNASEDAIEGIRNSVAEMDLSKYAGENVDKAVSFVLSLTQVLESASTKDRSFIPDDFPCKILKVFQTSSVPEFNEAFKEEERKA